MSCFEYICVQKYICLGLTPTGSEVTQPLAHFPPIGGMEEEKVGRVKVKKLVD